MSVVSIAYLPDGFVFLFDYSSARFVHGGDALVTPATDERDGRGVLLAFDTATGAEQGRLQVGYVPCATSVVETGARTLVAVAHATAPRGRVAIVDATNLSALSTLATAVLPKNAAIYNVNDVALAPDGSVGFVASADGNALFAFDMATGAILSRTPAGFGPTATRFAMPGGSPRVVVTSELTGDLLTFDVADPRAPRLIATFSSPASLLDEAPALSRDGTIAICTSVDNNRLSAARVESGALVANGVVGDKPIASAFWEGPEGQFALVLGERSRSVSCVKITSSGFVTTGTFLGPQNAVRFALSQNVALSDDGRFAFVASAESNELIALDVESATVAGRLTVGRKPGQIAVRRDNQGRLLVAAVCAEDSTLAIVDATDARSMVLRDQASIDSPFPALLDYANVVFSSDGEYAFVGNAGQFLYAVDTSTVEVVGAVGTGFVPLTIAEREAEGRRILAVLNVQAGATSVAVVDATEPRNMTILAKYPAPESVEVALNNVPAFSSDGQYVIVGASFSRKVFTIGTFSGLLAGTATDTNAVRPVTFADGSKQKFAAVNLGPNAASLYRLSKKGVPKPSGSFQPPEGSYFVAGNNPTIGPDGTSGVVPNYGRGSILTFDARSGELTGEIALGAGPGDIAVDWANGRVVALEVNGTASSLIVADLAESASSLAAQFGSEARTAPTHRMVRDDSSRSGIARGSIRSSRGSRSVYSETLRRIITWQPLSKQK